MRFPGWRSAALAAAVVFAACDQSIDPAGIDSIESFGPAFAVTIGDIAIEELVVCKEGPTGTYTFDVATTSGGVSYNAAVVSGGSFTLLADECKLVATSQGGTVQVTEQALAGTHPVDVLNYVYMGTAASPSGPATLAATTAGGSANSLNFGNDFGRLLLFRNEADPPTGGGCTFTQGYWKNHESAWPVTTLTLGNVSYSQAELLSILRQPVKGNGLVSLSHQLIAAKLNVANGADGSAVSGDIASADALIGDLVVPPVGSGVLAPSATSSLNGALDAYNNGVTGPGHCGD